MLPSGALEKGGGDNGSISRAPFDIKWPQCWEVPRGGSKTRSASGKAQGMEMTHDSRVLSTGR